MNFKEELKKSDTELLEKYSNGIWWIGFIRKWLEAQKNNRLLTLEDYND